MGDVGRQVVVSVRWYGVPGGDGCWVVLDAGCLCHQLPRPLPPSDGLGGLRSQHIVILTAVIYYREGDGGRSAKGKARRAGWRKAGTSFESFPTRIPQDAVTSAANCDNTREMVPASETQLPGSLSAWGWALVM